MKKQSTTAQWFYSQSFNGRIETRELPTGNTENVSATALTPYPDYIVLDSTNCGSFCGPIATRYAYTPRLRKRLDEVFTAAQNSSNRYFVLEDDTVVAAQSTRTEALKYMNANRVLVTVMDYAI